MNAKALVAQIGKLGMLRFFPSDPNAQVGIAEIVAAMATTDEQIEWLVNRMLAIYNEWPGPVEMRACFCARYRPADGRNACSNTYLEGSWPVDPTAPPRSGTAIEGPARLALPPGAPASVDHGANAALRLLVNTNRITRSIGGPATPEEIRTAPQWLRRLEGFDE